MYAAHSSVLNKSRPPTLRSGPGDREGLGRGDLEWTLGSPEMGRVCSAHPKAPWEGSVFTPGPLQKRERQPLPVNHLEELGWEKRGPVERPAAGVRATGAGRLEGRALEEARGRRGWKRGGAEVPKDCPVCQALYQAASCISRHSLTTYYVPGSVLAASLLSWNTFPTRVEPGDRVKPRQQPAWRARVVFVLGQIRV